MKKKIRQMCCFLILISMCVSGAGCRKKDEPAADAGYKIYYMNQEGTGLVEEPYHGEVKDPHKAVEEMLDSLRKSEDSIEEQPAVPKGVKIESYTLEDEKLTLYFNGKYGEMDVVREVLCRAALVRSLTQIEGVDLVAVYVDGSPLANRSGEVYGFQQAEDFVQNTGSSINSYQDTSLTMFFANDEGNGLIREEVKVRYNSNLSREKLIVERLMKGPSAGRGQGTIPKGTKLLGVSVKDGICYLNFDEGLKNTTPGVGPETVIYSIVNSVTENGAVSRVQISINGDSKVTFQESVNLSEPLSRNLDIVEEE